MLLLLSIMFVTQTTDGSLGDYLQIANYGFAGAMLVLFIAGKVHSDNEVKDLKEVNAKLLTALLGASNVLGSSALPALDRSAQLVQRTADPLLTDLRELLVRLESVTPPKDDRHEQG